MSDNDLIKGMYLLFVSVWGCLYQLVSMDNFTKQLAHNVDSEATKDF
jgi:hypothetical protein